MDALREQMMKDLRLKGITPGTQKKYLREVSMMANYFDKPLEERGEEEVKDYLVHMLETRKLSRGTYRGYVAGIKFLYKTTLNREEVVEKIQYPKAKKTLPVVLDLAEIKAMLSVTENLKHRALLTITYSAGLRVSEAAKLKVTDIDSKRMMVRVQQGKGRKHPVANRPCTAEAILAAVSSEGVVIRRAKRWHPYMLYGDTQYFP